MKKYIILPLVALMAACGGHSHSHEHEHEHHHAHESHESHESHAHGEITLHKHVADEFGVETGLVEQGEFATVVRCSGVVISSAANDAVVSAPLAGVVRYASNIEQGSSVQRGAVVATIDAGSVVGGDANAAARAALEAAKTEYERIEALYADRLATVGERNAALAAYNQAKAACSPAASGRALSPIAGTVTELLAREGQYVAAGEVIAAVADGKAPVLRIDLPRRYQDQAATYADATIVLPYGGSVKLGEVGGKRVNGSAIASAATQSSAYLPIYFSAGHAQGLAPGASFTAYLAGTPRPGVVSVPVTALSEQQGDFFVYEQLDEDCYEKHRVEIGANDGRRVEILSGIEPGATIVTKGVTTIRLAEMGSNIPEGHTHNH